MDLRNMNNANRQREKNTGSGKNAAPITTVLAVFIMISLLNNIGQISAPVIIAVVSFGFIAALIALGFFMIGKAVKKGNKGSEDPALRIFRNKEVEDRALSSTMRKAAPAVYNEKSAEELFYHDHQERLAQLDVFLKNGIIDKKEYAILKERYLKISYERN